MLCSAALIPLDNPRIATKLKGGFHAGRWTMRAAACREGAHHEVRRKESLPALPSGPPQMALVACDSVPARDT